jgi:flavodoxin
LRRLKPTGRARVEHFVMSTVHVHRTDQRRALVVYFSRDGHTRHIAQEIAQAYSADLEQIRTLGNRRGLLGYVRCALEALLGIEPALHRDMQRLERYGLVIIGTPIWFWNIASPVRAWVARHRAELPRVALFCTYGGSGATKVFADLERLCGGRAVATLALTEGQCADEDHMAQVRRFAADCERDVSEPATRTSLARPAP